MKNTTDLLKKLVSIQSVFPNEKECALWIEEFLKVQGFKVQRQKVGNNRWNLLAEKGKGKSSLLFYGHIDTVPKYGNWETDPFKLTEKDDKLFGRGACDMKGGIAALLSALIQVKTDKKIKLFFGVDEENISEGAWRAIEEKKSWFSDVEAVLVGEPGASATQIGGVNVVTLGRRGRVVFAVDVFGKAYHGAHPEKGVNAIDEAAKIALALGKINLQKNKFLGEGSLFVRKFESASTSLSIPDIAYIEIDRHLVLPETINTAKKQIENLIDSLYKAKILSKDSDFKTKVYLKQRATPYIEPYVTDKNNIFVKNVLSLIKNNFNKEIVINYGKSVADDNIFAAKLKVPVVTIGPRGGNIHSANEWVSKQSLNEVTALYKMIIENY